MATTTEILNKEFELLKNDLIQQYDASGMRSSGKFADGLEVEAGVNTVKLTGDKYAEQLEYGRKSGKRPPIDAIKQWIVDKGIVNNIKGNISVSSLAFLIARKIGKQGWNRSQHGGVELISKVVTDIRMQSIINKVGAELTLTLVRRLQNELKTILV